MQTLETSDAVGHDLTAPSHGLTPPQLSAAISYAKSLRDAGRIPKAIGYLVSKKVLPAEATEADFHDFLVRAEADRVRSLQATVARLEDERLNDEKRIYREAVEDFRETDVSICARADTWPTDAMAEVVRKVRNPRMVVIRLEDGREASMWRNGGRWAIGSRTVVKMETKYPEPIYEPVW